MHNPRSGQTRVSYTTPATVPLRRNHRFRRRRRLRLCYYPLISSRLRRLPSVRAEKEMARPRLMNLRPGQTAAIDGQVGISTEAKRGRAPLHLSRLRSGAPDNTLAFITMMGTVSTETDETSLTTSTARRGMIAQCLSYGRWSVSGSKLATNRTCCWD